MLFIVSLNLMQKLIGTVKCYSTEEQYYLWVFVLLLFLNVVCVLQNRSEVCCSWLIMAESQSPSDSLDVHQSCGNIQNVSQRPQLQSSLQCGYSTSLPEMLRDVIIAPYGCCDPHDPIIASQSRPSSRGVQARSNLKTSEWRGSGLWTCGRSGNGCMSLRASANLWLSRSQWRCSGHRRRPQCWTSTQDKFLNTAEPYTTYQFRDTNTRNIFVDTNSIVLRSIAMWILLVGKKTMGLR